MERNDSGLTNSAQNETDSPLGQRERIKRQYRENGIDGTSESEILELLLYHSSPMRDTKAVSHRLLANFGSISEILNVREEYLIKEGASDADAFLLKLVGDMVLFAERQKEKRAVFDDYDVTGRYMCMRLKSEKTEHAYALLLDGENRALGEIDLGEGNFDGVRINVRKLVEECIYRKAARVILAHNHPSGRVEASVDDYMTTNTVEGMLNGIGVKLAEHYIVSGGEYLGIKRTESIFRAVKTGREHDIIR